MQPPEPFRRSPPPPITAGPDLADLIEETVAALNERDFPTSSSLVSYFNKDLVERLGKEYEASIERAVALPGDVERIEATSAALADGTLLLQTSMVAVVVVEAENNLPHHTGVTATNIAQSPKHARALGANHTLCRSAMATITAIIITHI